jgi:hypothetical protein
METRIFRVEDIFTTNWYISYEDMAMFIFSFIRIPFFPLFIYNDFYY